jgi:hypothetical protein
MSPQSIILEDGRILRVCNYPSIGNSSESAIDPITGKVFLAGSIGEAETFWTANGFSLYKSSLSGNIMTNILFKSGEGFTQIVANLDHIFILNRVGGVLRFSKIDKITGNEVTYRSPAYDATADCNLSTGRVIYDFPSPNRHILMDFDLNTIAIPPSLNASPILLNNNSIWVWDYPYDIKEYDYSFNYIRTLASYPSFNGAWGHKTVVNQTYYFCNSMIPGGYQFARISLSDGSITYFPTGTGVFRAVYCFTKNGDVLIQNGRININTGAIQNIFGMIGSDICADERYCTI